ncbi:hypothetical protein EVAR_29100_1 [Eumeta japonica]|uniref:Uncharacterized protein n=1 Tax=Eumeta variegata TaxID=151549 RepID=A0A4C1VMW5_EUMVA|nr:hypothetical protein EVAR_29100_1 [Eumeta japonica]
MAGGERASRPCSLLLEGAPPEREPLHFDVQLVGAPPEVEQLVNNIKQVAEDFLYHWKMFPIVLPPSQFTELGCRPSDILIAPPCDELDAAALDAGVEPHPLSPKQLHSIREKGLDSDPVQNIASERFYGPFPPHYPTFFTITPLPPPSDISLLSKRYNKLELQASMSFGDHVIHSGDSHGRFPL